MKIEALTDKPQDLVNAINKMMEDDELLTWKKVANAKGEVLYSHTPSQWNETAMPKPHVKDDRVSFVITWWKKNGEPEESVKGYILGRFTEILIVHFKDHFSKLEVKK